MEAKILQIVAGRDANIAGAQIEGSTRAIIQAERNLNLGAIENEDKTNAQVTKIKGENVGLSAGNDLNMAASIIEAGTAQLHANGDINMTTITQKTPRKVTDVGVSIQADNMSMSAGKNMNLKAIKLDVKTNTVIAANGDVNIMAGSSHESQSTSKEETKTKDLEILGMKLTVNYQEGEKSNTTINTAVGSVLKTGGTLQITSGGNPTIQVSQLRAGGLVDIEAAGKLSIENI